MIYVLERETFLELWSKLLKTLADEGLSPGSADKKRLQMILNFVFREDIALDYKLIRIVDQPRDMSQCRMIFIGLGVLYGYLENLDQPVRDSCEVKLDELEWRLRRSAALLARRA